MSKLASNKKECSIKSIDYYKEIQAMNDNTFKLCLSKLYDLLDFKVIDESDVRKIDVVEKLAIIDEIIRHQNEDNSLNAYLKALQAYVNNSLNIETKSRASKFAKRLNDLVNRALDETGSSYDIEDILFNFAILFKGCDFSDESDGMKVTDVTTSISMDDFDVLFNIFDSKKCFITSAKKKAVLIDKLIKEDKTAEIYYEKYVYINNVIFLCKALQTRGLI